MPARVEGDLVFVFLEHLNEWVDGTVLNYIKGFGYEVDITINDEITTGKFFSRINTGYSG